MEYDAKSRNIHKADLAENMKTKTEFLWSINPDVETDDSWNKNYRMVFHTFSISSSRVQRWGLVLTLGFTINQFESRCT